MEWRSSDGRQEEVQFNLEQTSLAPWHAFKTLTKASAALLPTLFCLLGLLTAMHPTLLTGFQFIQTDPGDTRLNNYFLEQGYRWFLGLFGTLGGGPSYSFWDAPFFYPSKNAMAYSDILLGSAPIYWALRGFSFLPDTAFQLWCAALLTLNFVCSFALLRKLHFSNFASCAGAYLFAFATARIGQIGHAQLLPHFYTPLALLGLHGVVMAEDLKKKLWGLGLFIGSLVAELYSGFYLGWFNAFGLSLLCGVVILHPKVRRAAIEQALKPSQIVLLKKILPWGALFGLGAVLSLLPMAQHYYQASQQVGLRNFGAVSPMLLRLQSWFFLGEEHPIYSQLLQFSAFKRIPVPGEQRAGLGFLTLSLVCYGLWKQRKRPVVQLSVWIWVLIGVFSLYTGRRFFGVEPWDLVYRYFPGAQAIRAVARLCLLALIPASIGLAAGFDSLADFLKNSVGEQAGKKLGTQMSSGMGWVLSAVFLLVAAEQVIFTPSYDKFKSRAEIEALTSQVPKKCGKFFYSALWSDEPAYKLQIDAMWASMTLGIPTLNGYSGNQPPGYGLGIISQRAGPNLEQQIKHWDPEFDLDCWVWSRPL